MLVAPRCHSPMCRAPSWVPLLLSSRHPGSFPGWTSSLLGCRGDRLRRWPCKHSETVTSLPCWGPPRAPPHARISYLCSSPGGPARGCCCSCWWTRHGGGSPGATWGRRDPGAPPVPSLPWAEGPQRSHHQAPGPRLLGSMPGGCHRRGGLSCKAPESRPFWWGGEWGGGCPALGSWPQAARNGPGTHWDAGGDEWCFPPPRCPPAAGGGAPPPGCQFFPVVGGKQPLAGLRCHLSPRPLCRGHHQPHMSPSQPLPPVAGQDGGPCAHEPGGPGDPSGGGCGVLPPRCPSGSCRRCQCSPGLSPPHRCR